MSNPGNVYSSHYSLRELQLRRFYCRRSVQFRRFFHDLLFIVCGARFEGGIHNKLLKFSVPQDGNSEPERDQSRYHKPAEAERRNVADIRRHLGQYDEGGAEQERG